MATIGFIDYAGAGTEYVDTPDADLADPTGDFELIVCVEPDSWALSNWMPLVTKHDGSTITYIWQLRPGSGGLHYMLLEVRDNTNTKFVSQSSIDSLMAVPTAPRWFRVRYDHDTGSGSYAVDWWYSDDPVDTAIGSISWTSAGAQDTGTNATINDTATTTKLMGTTFSTNQAVAAGKLYAASIIYGGAELADPDFRDGDQTSDAGETFVDSYGNVWTVGGTNSWVEPVSDGNTGSASTAQANQTSTATGEYTPPPVSGSATSAQANQVGSAAGSFDAPTFTGSSASDQGDQTSTASGTHTAPVFAGTVAVGQADDTATATATHTAPVFAGEGAVTQEDDTADAAGTFAAPVYTGTVAATQDDQTVDASGTFTPTVITGTVAVTQADQTGSAAGTFAPEVVTGTVVVTQEGDSAVATGTFTPIAITGTAAPVQENQTVDASGTFALPTFTGSSAAAQADNIGSATGTVLNTYTGTVAAIEENDVAVAVGVLGIIGELRSYRDFTGGDRDYTAIGRDYN